MDPISYYTPPSEEKRGPVGAPQFTPDNLRQIHDAQFKYRRIARALSVAKFDAWTILIFGVLSILFGLTSLTSLIVGAGLCAVAIVELKQMERLKRLQFSSLLVLAKNQLVLGGLLILYACYMLYGAATGPSPLASVSNSDPTVQEYLKPYEGLVQTMSYAVYGGLILIALGAQGGMALYYYTRRKYLSDYLTETPAWLIDMQKAGMKL